MAEPPVSLSGHRPRVERGTERSLHSNRPGWLLVAPALVVLLGIGLVPGLYVLYLSFFRSSPGQEMEFVAFSNYARLIGQPRFLHSLLVTGVLVLAGLTIQIGFGLLLAVALDAIGVRVRRLAVTVLILPMLMTPVVIGILFRLLLRPRTGPIDYVLSLLGLDSIPWLVNPSWALVAVLLAETWQWTPFLTVILLAGLQSQSPEVAEASLVDGASEWQRFRRITLPLLGPILALAATLRTIDAFKSFDIVYVLTRGGPASATETVGFYTYLSGFTYFDLGLTAAMSVVQVDDRSRPGAPRILARRRRSHGRDGRDCCMTRSRRTHRLAMVIVITALVAFLVPIYWLVNTAFKPFSEASGGYPPSFLPNTPTLDNFAIALVERGGLGSLRDSAIVAVGTLLLCLLISVPAAYGVSRFRLQGGRLPMTILSFRFMPAVVVSIALYQASTATGLQDTHLALIIVNTLISLPFMIWLLKGFFDEIPREIEEAAFIDGASRLQSIRHVIVPLSTPGLISTGLFAFIFAWNELLFAIILTDVSVRPFAKLIPGLTSGVNEPHWSAMAAISIVVIVPIVVVAFYVQRFLVRGLTYGALK